MLRPDAREKSRTLLKPKLASSAKLPPPKPRL